MVVAEVKLPDQDAEMIMKVITKLGGKIKVIDKEKTQLTPFAKKLKKDLEQGFKEIKLHQAGKIQLKTVHELLDEL